MKGKSSSKQNKNGVELENLGKVKEETHLSGSYIRSLVKQLTSSRTKERKNSDGEVSSSDQNLAKIGEGFSDNKPESQQPPQQHKKQVRRRLHTSRPYQERLLNMAEARREIVTALKFHRAAMKKAGEQKQQQQMEIQPLMESSSQQICLEQEAKLKSRRNPRIYAANSTSNLSNYNYSDNLSNYSGFCPPHNPYSWPLSPVVPPPLVQENLNFSLPNQTLGLNLNFQDFNNLDTTLYHNSNNPPFFSSSSASSSSSPPLSATATEELPCMEAPPLPDVVESGVLSGVDLDLHPAMDDKEIAEIRSIGEQHQMEWNDTLNLVTSAWWFKFLKSMEIAPDETEKAEENYGFSPLFDEVMEFPAWLNANDSCLQHLNDYHSDDYLQDPALPCMEIEEIEGMDGDWLA